jgi:hypothetical protein
MLALQPGRMQREYLEGHRIKHQKPFSMFFICASLLAVAMYWFAEKSEPDTGIVVVYEKFLQSYYVLSHIVLLPF